MKFLIFMSWVPRQNAFGEELYPSVVDKAAAMVRGIIADHPFVDGNKRTALLADLTLLEINGLQFAAQTGEIEDFAVKIATDKLDVPHKSPHGSGKTLEIKLTATINHFA